MGYDFGVGREAPTFALVALDGSTIDLDEYRGDWFPVLVFFSAESAAAPAQLKALGTQAATFWGLRGQLVGVTAAAEPDAAAAAFVDVPFPIVLDDGSTAAAYGAAKAVAGEAPPLAMIVDRAGKVVWMGEGDDDLKPAALLGALRAIAR